MDEASARVVETAKRKLGLGDGDGAVALLRGAVSRAPGDPALRLVLGQILIELGKPAEAIIELTTALDADNTSVATASALALALHQTGETSAAYAVLLPFVTAQDVSYDACLNFSQICLALDLGDQGAEAARSALALEPNSSAAAVNLFLCDRTKDDLKAWRELHETALAQPGLATVRAAAAESLYLSSLSEAEITAVHQEVGERLAKNIAPTRRYSGSRDPERTLKVGFLSPDFRSHPVASFSVSFLKHWDGEQFPLTFYSLNHLEDEVTERFKTMGRWRPSAGQKATALASQIMADGIDVLIDLAGYTVGGRPEILAMRPSPVVLSAIGYPASLHLARVDGEFTDEIAAPMGATVWANPIRLPNPFLCYAPVETIPNITAKTTPTAGFRWGVACNAKKINVASVELWASVLRATPGSTLHCGCPEFSRTSELERVRSLFVAAGVSDRCVLFTGVRNYSQYMAAYNSIDAVLDTFPFNGATTTMDALLMGVPVLSLSGPSHRSRVGVSLLSALSKPNWHANTPESFLTNAVKVHHADSPDLIAREALREQVQSSGLTNGVEYAKNFAQEVRNAWHRYCIS